MTQPDRDPASGSRALWLPLNPTREDMRALDVQVAQAAGYDAHVTDKNQHIHGFGFDYVHMVVDGVMKPVPEYSTDLNAAIELLKLMPMGGLTIDEDGATWIATAFLDGAGVVADAEADTPALAICRAYLAYTTAPGDVGAVRDAGNEGG